MPIPPQTERLKAIDAAILRNGADMRSLLLRARDKVQLDILRAVQSGNLANAAWLRDNLYSKLRKDYAGLQGDMATWTKGATKNIAKLWVGYAVADLPRGNYKAAWSTFSKKYLENTVAKFSPSTMMDRAAVKAGQLDPVMGGMLKQDIDTLRKVVMDAQRLQAATGMTANEFRKTVQDEVLKSRGAWTFIDRAGRTWETKNYFNMLNRTLAAETSREAYRDTMTEAGYDLATIEGGIGPNCCEACEKWAGKIVSITGKTKGYPSQDEAISEGLFHPRCRHYLAVVLSGDEDRAKQDEKEMRDYATEQGFPLTDSKVKPNDVETPKPEITER